MSVLDMDISTRRTPQSVRKRRFAVVRRGFDPDQVQTFLDQVAGWIEQLESELHTAREELDVAARRAQQPVDPYNRLGARVAELMRTAEEQAERIQREAEEEATRRLDDLQSEVDRIRNESRTGAERLRQEAEQEATRLQGEAVQTLERARTEAAQTLDRARGEANSILASLTGQRDMLVTELRATRRRLSELVGSIDATVEATPAFPLSGLAGSQYDPWAEPPAPPAPQPPQAAQPSQQHAPSDPSERPEPPPVPPPPQLSDMPDVPTRPQAVEAPERPEPEELIDPFEGPDPFAPPPSGTGLFDDFATGPSYEGAGTGQPLFDDPDLRPRTYGDIEPPSGYETHGSNGFQAGGIGPAAIGEPTSFELPAGEAIDLTEYAEDDPEVTPTIELSLPDIPSFDDGEDEPESESE